MDIDIIWHVFDIISDENTMQLSLDTIRAASQVCTTWRSLLLSSSSIWAKLINFDFFNRQSSDEWMHEVLRRAGSSPMYIQSSKNYLSPSRSSFLETLLEHTWHRLKVFNVRFTSSVLHDDSVLARLLWRPAPLLETFHILVYFHPWANPTHRTRAQFNLPGDFGKQAPRLRSFKGPLVCIPVNAEWESLSGLHTLSFKIDFGASKLFHILSSLPFLERLSITAVKEDTEKDEIPLRGNLVLPRLTSIEISLEGKSGEHWTKYLTLLENIQLTMGHSLGLSVIAVTILPSLIDLERVSRIVCNSLGLNATCPELFIELTRGVMDIKTSGLYLYLHLHFYRMEYDPYLTAIFRALSTHTSRWENITNFTLLINPNIGASGDTSLGMLISSLTNLKHLRVKDYESLAYIYTCPVPSQIELFPSLQTIEVDSLEQPFSKNFYLINFLHRRVQIGKPIRTVLLNNITKPEFRFLKRFAGLEIIWGPARQFKHVCGIDSSISIKE